jgi:hypothetical protein
MTAGQHWPRGWYFFARLDPAMDDMDPLSKQNVSEPCRVSFPMEPAREAAKVAAVAGVWGGALIQRVYNAALRV